MPSTTYGSVPFGEQISFFRRKLNIPTAAWPQVYGPEHGWAFMVAGANRDALVADFRRAIEKVIEGGGTLAEFRRDFDRIVNTQGWDYNGGRSWRSRVIYDTNLMQSYNAGRYQQLQAQRQALPYLRYRHSDAVEDPRPEHQAWDGMVLRSDDPWWDTYFPSNGWGCQCYVEGLSQEDVDDLGLTVSEAPPIEWETRTIGQRSPDGPRTVRVPKGIDPGFEYAPGRSRLNGATPPELPDAPPGASGAPGIPNRRATDSLPPPRQVSADRLLSAGLSDAEYANEFLGRFGATLDEPTIFRDVLGEPLVMGRELFVTRRTGELKAAKRGRGPYMALLAEAVADPDEIWVRIEQQAARNTQVVRRRYIARFELPDDELPLLAVFERGASGWSGITVYDVRDPDINELRFGVRLYRREQ